MIITHIAAESNPFIKTGGLGDVVYALTQALSNDNTVRVIIPLYTQIKDKIKKATLFQKFNVRMNWRQHNTDVYTLKEGKVTYYFIENGYYFNRSNIYGYEDDNERYAFFALAAVELIKKIKSDVVHVHDWQAGVVPLLLRNAKIKAKTVLTIHNPAFQGNFSPALLFDYLNLNYSYYESGLMRFNNDVSTLKTGIMVVDKITTVSITHRDELLEDNGSYNDLARTIKFRRDDFIGIVNGVDYQEFNPKTDKLIDVNYLDNITTFKDENKQALEKTLFGNTTAAPLFGLVTRLTSQKGIDRVIGLLEEIIKNNERIIVLGSGEVQLQAELNYYASKAPKNVNVYIGYNDILAHKIYAACDFFLMPSVFEPCGIGQMIALHYANIPLTSSVGGLKDTINDFRTSEKGNGLRFAENEDLNSIYLEARKLYKNKSKLKLIRENAFTTDNSWKNSALKYQEIYTSLLK